MTDTLFSKVRQPVVFGSPLCGACGAIFVAGAVLSLVACQSPPEARGFGPSAPDSPKPTRPALPPQSVEAARVRRDDARLENCVTRLQSLDVGERLEAVWALKEMGASARPAVAELLVALEDEDDNVRSAVVWALPEIERDPDSVGSQLWQAAANDRSRQVRARAVRSLAKLGPAAIPIILSTLSNGEERVRAIASHILREIAARTEEGATRLANGLAAADPSTRKTIAWSLWELGDRAGPATHQLVGALADEQEEVRYYCIRALGKIGSNALPSLLVALTDDNLRVRSGAALALGRMGTTARSAAPQLRALLSDSAVEVRDAARRALSQIEGETAALPASPYFPCVAAASA